MIESSARKESNNKPSSKFKKIPKWYLKIMRDSMLQELLKTREDGRSVKKSATMKFA
jgi:hypothetical protein